VGKKGEEKGHRGCANALVVGRGGSQAERGEREEAAGSPSRPNPAKKKKRAPGGRKKERRITYYRRKKIGTSRVCLGQPNGSYPSLPLVRKVKKKAGLYPIGPARKKGGRLSSTTSTFLC